MDAQHIITMLIVAVAAVYLARCFVSSARGFFSKREGGCGGGCGKCAFAQPSKHVRPVAGTRPQGGVIPLGEIRATSSRLADVSRRTRE